MEARTRTQRYFGTDSALFLGPLGPPSPHRHHAIQGCVALRGLLRIEVAGAEPIALPAVLIAPDVTHAVSAPGPVAHFYLLPETAAGSRIVERFAGRPVIGLGDRGLARVRRLLREALVDERRFPRCLEALTALALRGAPPKPRRDPRVEAVLDTLRLRSVATPLAALADEAGLSPDRLRHLFRAELGVPLRRYRRWLRLLVALDALRAGDSASEAAHAAGFADSAHLTRVFREAFTFPPSVFARDSRFVQAPAVGNAPFSPG